MEEYNTVIDIELENFKFIEDVNQRLYNVYMALCYGEKYREQNFVVTLPYSMIEARYNELNVVEEVVEEQPII